MRSVRRVWLAAGGLLVLAGVGLAVGFLRDTEPTVTGTVRLDNQPLTTGSIAWIPIEGTPGPGGGGGFNSDGKYEIKRGLRPGKYRVEIRSSVTLNRKVVNPTIPADLVDEEVSVIPARYNTTSGLFREVVPGSNVWDFNLEAAATPRKAGTP
ncbi:MAG TPA: hypothetical protein VKD90_24830 [Gemmataceae bacterium]|nr:hypothetical protein [Gemmataceae bacterium]